MESSPTRIVRPRHAEEGHVVDREGRTERFRNDLRIAEQGKFQKKGQTYLHDAHGKTVEKEAQSGNHQHQSPCTSAA